MNFNDAGLKLLKDFEGCRLDAYQDLNGNWTIGYGHRLSSYNSLCDGYVISQAEADQFLLEDVNKTASYVTEEVSRWTTDNEFSAIVCLVYNIGIGNFRKSMLLEIINDCEDPTQEWLKWSHAAGKVVPGLLRRRKAELELFNAPEIF